MKTRKAFLYVFVLVSLISLISAEENIANNAGVLVDVDCIQGLTCPTGVGHEHNVNDGDFNTFFGTGYGRADGYTSHLVAAIRFENISDISKITYKRLIRNGGSEHGRVAWERLYISDQNGWHKVYEKDWSGMSFDNQIDTIIVNHAYTNIKAVKVDLYASVGGHTSGNDLRVYEISVLGSPVDNDSDDDGVPDNEDCAPKDASKWREVNAFYDNDSDGFGSGSVKLCIGTNLPSKYSLINSDCNDNNALIWKYLNGYFDNDSDGFGAPGVLQVCSGNNLPSRYVSVDSDCNDVNISINPSATEVCNGVDDNCNGVVDENCSHDNNETNQTIASVTGLHLVNKTTNTITWAWTNPNDSNFKEVLIFLNTIQVSTTSGNSYTATGLTADTRYTIEIFTKNKNNFINETGVSNTQWTNKESSDDDDDDDDDEDKDNNIKKKCVQQDINNSIVLNSGKTNVSYTPIELKTTNVVDNESSFDLRLYILPIILIVLIVLLIILLFALR